VIEVHVNPERLGDGVRMLDRAEGILVGLRRCRVDTAFDEIVGASQRHGVPAMRVAQALVELAEGRAPHDTEAAAVARAEWAELLADVSRR
jgi:hypothetical protein